MAIERQCSRCLLLLYGVQIKSACDFFFVNLTEIHSRKSDSELECLHRRVGLLAERYRLPLQMNKKSHLSKIGFQDYFIT